MSSINDKQDNSGDKESPCKISQFILILSGFIDRLVCFQHILKKNYDYRNIRNLIKTTIIEIISKSGQGINPR